MPGSSSFVSVSFHALAAFRVPVSAVALVVLILGCSVAVDKIDKNETAKEAGSPGLRNSSIAAMPDSSDMGTFEQRMVRRTAAAKRRPPGQRVAQAPSPEAPADAPAPPEETREATPEPEEQPPETAPAPPERRRLPPPSPAGDLVSLNFNRADLVEIIHILAQHLKLTYTIDPEVKGTVTIHSAEPLKKEDLLPIFHQILRMNGAAAIKTGNIYRIVPLKSGKGLARPLGQGREDGFALQVIPVRFFSVAEMKKLLTPFLTPDGEIIEYPRGNFLIVVDLPSNIQRLVEIRDLIDVQVFAGTRMEIYQPKVASAEELAEEMTKIMQSYASSVPQSESFVAQFLPLPRINQLLVIAHSEAAWTYAKRWLERIDVVAEGPGRRIFIYPVENGKATELADVLNQALGQPSTGRREPGKTLQDLHRATPGGLGGLTGQRPTTPPLGAGAQPTPQTPPLGAYAVAPAPGQPPVPAGQPSPPPQAAPRPPATPAPAPKAEEQMRIVPDPATNSLVIYGTAQEFQNIKNILKELDVIPRQVLMDVLVAEVTLTDDLSFGIEYEIFRRTGVSIFGNTFPSQGAIRSGILGAPPESGATQFGTGISGVIGRSNAVRAFINALMTDSRVKILSSPSVLATDNRPARIQVGTEEPVPTGTITAAVGQPTVSSSTTIQYRNTGRIVTIIPQVNSLGLVNLQIKAEVSQRGANVPIGASGETFPSFNTRDAETTAVVQDGETLVIGGIITENKTRERTGIPYLMDIPVLGRFFGVTSDEVARTELVMLITPNVIRNKDESRRVTEEFKQKLSIVRDELERMRRDQEKDKAKRQMLKPETPPPPVPEPESKGNAEEKEMGGRMELPATPRIDKEAAPIKPAVKQVPEPPVKLDEEEPPPSSLPLQKVKAEDGSHSKGMAAALEPVGEARLPNIMHAAKTKTENQEREKLWAVQVKSHPDEKISSAVVRQLANKGYDAYMLEAVVKGQTWYRVRVGLFPERQQAENLKELLKSKEGFVEAFTVVR